MKQYLDLLKHVMTKGRDRGDRTGTGTRGVFGAQLRFDLREGFPLVTTKKMPMRWIVEELLWFLSGDTNVKKLQEAGVSIWDEWATKEQCAKFNRAAGDLGPIYSHQWRNFGATSIEEATGNDLLESLDDRYVRLPSGYFDDGVDQIAQLLSDIRSNPNSRRLIVTGWNPVEATQVALPPCHTLFQFYVQDGELSCHLYQRSADLLLGVPFNIASYALLTSMVAQVSGLKVGEFIHTFGDAHVYRNHFEQVELQLSREPRPLPRLIVDPSITDLEGFRSGHFTLEGYDPHPAIKAAIAI